MTGRNIYKLCKQLRQTTFCVGSGHQFGKLGNPVRAIPENVHTRR